MVDELTNYQISAFKEGFSLFDKKGNGCISTKELGTLMLSLGHDPTDAELQDIIDEANAARYGTIYFPEFLNLMSHHIKENNDSHELKKAFRLSDQDQDVISVADICLLMENMGGKITDEEIDVMIRIADLDGGGQINYEEFLKFIKETPFILS